MSDIWSKGHSVNKHKSIKYQNEYAEVTKAVKFVS